MKADLTVVPFGYEKMDSLAARLLVKAAVLWAMSEE